MNNILFIILVYFNISNLFVEVKGTVNFKTLKVIKLNHVCIRKHHFNKTKISH